MTYLPVQARHYGISAPLSAPLPVSEGVVLQVRVELRFFGEIRGREICAGAARPNSPGASLE